MARDTHWFSYDPTDYLDQVFATMTTRQYGAYCLLRDAAWFQNPPCSLPSSVVVLQKLARLGPREWKVDEISILAAFELREDGRYYDHRLEQCYQTSKSKSDKARQSAKVRWGKLNQSKQKNANAMRTQCERNAPSNASPHIISNVVSSVVAVNGKGLKGKPKKPEYSNEFEAFWQAWPAHGRRTNKPGALTKFITALESGGSVAEIMAGLEGWKKSNDWLRDGGQFIPLPATWLNQRRWEDVPAAAPASQWRAAQPWDVPPPMTARQAVKYNLDIGQIDQSEYEEQIAVIEQDERDGIPG